MRQSEIDSGRESHTPLDNVQRFERLREDARFLQDMVDLGEDPESINALTYNIDITSLVKLPVYIRGGYQQVPAISEDMTATMALAANTEVWGEYQGMTWRLMQNGMLKDSPSWQLFHVLLTGIDEYLDDEGNIHEVKRQVFITAADSSVDITSVTLSHDYRVLESDGFSLKIDQIALDDSFDVNQKLGLVARMIGNFDVENATPEQKKLLHQRLSYINHLDMFKGFCLSPYGYSRARDGERLTVLYGETEGQYIQGEVLAVGLDHLAMVDQDEDRVCLDTSNQVLCVEVNIEGRGVVSIPYIPGRTTILEAEASVHL